MGAWLLATLGVFSLLGCQRPAETEFVLSKDTLDLDAKLQAKVRAALTQTCGTPTRPKPWKDSSADPVRVERGVKVYQTRCAQCHGDSGDGSGPQAAAMYPRPRDYRRGVFKFTSTPYGAKPLRSDLIRTIRQGARGTSMPAFNLLPPEDIEAVVDHVLGLAHCGELETLLLLEAQGEDDIDPKNVPSYVEDVLKPWQRAASLEVLPMTRVIPYSLESAKLGEKAFLSEAAGCFKCHGNDGRGQVMAGQQEFKDVWGFQTRAADLTSGMFHGGNRPVDIYRRIYSGINGTPMPGFKDKLAAEPELFWHLVNYVQYVSTARRRATLEQQASYLPPPEPAAGSKDSSKDESAGKGAAHGE